MWLIKFYPDTLINLSNLILSEIRPAALSCSLLKVFINKTTQSKYFSRKINMTLQAQNNLKSMLLRKYYFWGMYIVCKEHQHTISSSNFIITQNILNPYKHTPSSPFNNSFWFFFCLTDLLTYSISIKNQILHRSSKALSHVIQKMLER